ncbi:hypothetical protein RUM43_002457 [Polyplax serrata]|uniref:Uncharacterized protein n=1 Tax=Polyplax serrata TaxID=468196 RepID=A0AAN8S4R9_POLSC
MIQVCLTTCDISRITKLKIAIHKVVAQLNTQLGQYDDFTSSNLFVEIVFNETGVVAAIQIDTSVPVPVTIDVGIPMLFTRAFVMFTKARVGTSINQTFTVCLCQVKQDGGHRGILLIVHHEHGGNISTSHSSNSCGIH